jgi:uncharacterized protein YecE (DUF72 family)
VSSSRKDPSAVLRVGPAGWSYEDWKGIVYPSSTPGGFDPLEYLAGYFDTLEINSTFYRLPSPSTVRSWARRVAGNSEFRFSVKLWGRFTHERSGWSERDAETFLDLARILREPGRLGAVLVQFPWSFKNREKERGYLWGLLDRLRDLPLVLEVRHASWTSEEIARELTERGVGICNLDQPLFRHSVGPGSQTTSALGYIRLHGRNVDDWFRGDAGRDERYDYLYSLSELREWAERIRKVRERTRETYVVTNNHFRGQAVANAVQLMNILGGGKKVAVPPPLVRSFPQLSGIRKPEPGQTDLFEG